MISVILSNIKNTGTVKIAENIRNIRIILMYYIAMYRRKHNGVGKGGNMRS